MSREPSEDGPPPESLDSATVAGMAAAVVPAALPAEQHAALLQRVLTRIGAGTSADT